MYSKVLECFWNFLPQNYGNPDKQTLPWLIMMLYLRTGNS